MSADDLKGVIKAMAEGDVANVRRDLLQLHSCRAHISSGGRDFPLGSVNFRRTRNCNEDSAVALKLEGQEESGFTLFHVALVLASIHQDNASVQIVEEMLDAFPHLATETLRKVELRKPGTSLSAHLLKNLKPLAFVMRLGLPAPPAVKSMLSIAANEEDSRVRLVRLPNKIFDELFFATDGDVQMRCHGGELVPSHKCILKSASPYLKRVFDEKWIHGLNQDGVWDAKLPSGEANVSYAVLMTIKKSIYTGVASLNALDMNQLQELFVASHLYELLALFRVVERRLVEHLNAEHFVDFLELATERQEDATELFGACKNYWKEQAFVVARTHQYLDSATDPSKAHIWARLDESVLDATTGGKGDKAEGA